MPGLLLKLLGPSRSEIEDAASKSAANTKRLLDSMSPCERAKLTWERERSSESLVSYLSLERIARHRELAVFQFLFLCLKKQFRNEHWEEAPARMLAEMRTAESSVRMHLPADQYDHAFWQNIVMWKFTDQTACECVNRMAVVETVFSDRLSVEAAEVGIAFMLRLLAESELTDRIWWRAFEVAQQLATRRASKSLTRDEMARARDCALLDKTHLAASVQRAISALS